MGDKTRVVISFFLLASLVLAFSWLSARVWGEKPEKISGPPSLILQGEMTVEEFGRRNGLPNPVLKNVFGLQTPGGPGKKAEGIHPL